MHEILYTHEARQAIQALRTKDRSQVEKAILRLAKDPSLGKNLTQELSQYRSYRSGDYRIIYRVLHKEIQIIIFFVGNRKSVYSVASRKLS